jgi:hypothetical protein
MPNLLRKPLPWMVLTECVIIGALAIVAWHMVSSPPVPLRSQAPPPSATAQAGEPASPSSAAVPDQPPPAVHQLLPGLNLDSSFWRQRLTELNRDQVSFEQLEWRLVHSAMDAASRYVKSVVVPSLVKAERSAH